MDQSCVVSVLMAVFNTEFSLVKRAIDSVLRQTEQDFEFIIIDDGSDNDPENRLLNYAKLFPAKITYIRHANCGQSRSVNRGIRNSTGRYIALLDADDEYTPDHLRACLAEMNSADLIASTTQTIVDRPEDYFVPDKADYGKLIHVDDCILFATLFGKREVFTSFPFEDRYAADALFYEHAAKQFRVQKVNLRTYIYYRNIPTSISATLKRQQTAHLH